MNDFRRITSAALDDDTALRVEQQAHRRGLSVEDYAALAIKTYADEAAAFDAFLAAGEASIAQGDFVEHDRFMSDLKRWRETRERPA